MRKNNSGVTIVSLVITIIVLIILAGVSINLIMGQDGLITKTKQAKENMELAQIEEQQRLNALYGDLENGVIPQEQNVIINAGTANTSQVLEGETFSSNLGKELLGTMKNNGAVTVTIAPGGNYTVPEGYHNGEGVITAQSAGTLGTPIVKQAWGWGGSGQTTLTNSITLPNTSRRYILSIVVYDNQGSSISSVTCDTNGNITNTTNTPLSRSANYTCEVEVIGESTLVTASAIITRASTGTYNLIITAIPIQ